MKLNGKSAMANIGMSRHMEMPRTSLRLMTTEARQERRKELDRLDEINAAVEAAWEAGDDELADRLIAESLND